MNPTASALDVRLPAVSLPVVRRVDPSRARLVLQAVFEDRREQLVHDAWTVRSLFASPAGPFRKAGFATRTLARAAAAELDRVGTMHGDPLDEAFWLLLAQRELLNCSTVDARSAQVLFHELPRLRPSQRRAAQRLLAARTRCLKHPSGGPASNLLLLAVLSGGLAAAASSKAFRAVVEERFPDGLSGLAEDELPELLLSRESRARLDERALTLDLSAPSSPGFLL